MSTYAGSADNGAIDLEYTPQPGRKICAADARHEELRAQLDDALIRIEQLEESMGRMQIVGGNRRPAPHRERRQPSVNEAIGLLQYMLDQHIAVTATDIDAHGERLADAVQRIRNLETSRCKGPQS